MVHYLHQLKVQRQHCFAVECWLQGNRSPAAAAALFAARYPPDRLGNPKAPDKFCKLWGSKHDKGQPIADGRGGGHYKLSRKQALKAASIYKRGLPGSNLPFHSVRQALALSPEMRQIQQECSNASPRALARAIKRHDKHLKLETIWFKSALRAATKKERLGNACWNLQQQHNNPGFWLRTIFADGHAVSLPPRTRWTGAGDDRHPRPTTRTHPWLNSKGGATKKAVVYGGVNMVVGAAGLVFCTGTSGLKTKFKASVAACCCRSPGLGAARAPQLLYINLPHHQTT